jgi:protein SCO1/2
MWSQFRNVCCGFCVGLSLVACGQKEPTSETPRTFEARGVVRELEPDGKTVVIAHEAISNYMGAMTMPFVARDPKELKDLKPGDAIAFQLVVTAKEGWVEHIVPRTNAAPSPTKPAAVQVSRATEPLGEGDALPDYHFTNELGETVHLSQYKGRAVAFTFFFTSCPFPNFCPRMTANFSGATEQLAKIPGLAGRWQLLSISFDPKTDTPARLLAYAKTAHYDPANWSFLTGDPGQISELADQFGENFWTDNGSISHNLRTVVVDPGGRVRKIFPSNNWTSEELVSEMTKVLP